jgi:hypothetical protein
MERPLRIFGRSMPRACAWLLMRSRASCVGCSWLIERAAAIERDAHLPTEFTVDILDTAFIASGIVGDRRCRWCAQERARDSESFGHDSRRCGRTERWGAIWIAPVEEMTVLVEWYGSNAPLTGSILVDIPRVEDSISGDMGGKVVESEDSTLMERAKRGDIVLSEG